MKITGLYYYPVKSFAGISLDRADITFQGIAGDREWMLVKPDGAFLTQRQDARLALIKPYILEGALWLSAPTMEDIQVSLATPRAQANVQIWKDSCKANIASQDVNEWIRDFLKWSTELWLVQYDSQFPRTPYQPERFGIDAAKFSDAAPFLVANEASLVALNNNLEKDELDRVTMQHFRPNIVISGPEAFAEHNLSKIEIGECRFALVDHCSRCGVITVNPDSGIKHPKQVPYQHLSALNSMPENKRVPAFGVNTKLENTQSIKQLTLAVGQSIKVY